MDIFHKFFLVARRDELHRAPVIPNYQMRILDLGTGTGIWAIDMSDKFQDAEVIGVDLSTIQPKWIPRNLRFHMCDFESEWTLGKESFDLIHLRQGCGSVSSWPLLYKRIFEYVTYSIMSEWHLKPGYGSLEHVEIDFQPRCDDGTLAPELNVVKWYNWLVDATQRSGKSLAYQHTTRQMLQSAGFVDIVEVVIRAPYNDWPADQHSKDVGRWFNLGMTEGLEALSLGPLTRVYHWSPEVVRGLIPNIAKEMRSKRIHAYNNIHIWTARRPQ
ncbi:MAG: Secondary metabolism regulator lae1 [Geoglossum umbratile]|nr:MAG: Secondary metabolism regulator lae1 [Geoglossum umbratile]